MRGLDPAALLATWEQGTREDALDRAATLLAAATGVGDADAAAWDVGSRDATLAAVLRGNAGATVWGCVPCAGCGGRLDVPVELGSVAASPRWAPGRTLEIEVDGATVSFRLPTTEDLRAVRGHEPVEARRLLLERCVGPDPSPEIVEAVESAMEDACPGGAVRIAVGCPDCGATTAVALDVSVLLWADLEARAVALLRDVHALATAYGWTEPDVLALTPQRRTAYLELAGA